MVTPDGQHMWNFGDGDWGTYSFNHYNFNWPGNGATPWPRR